MEVRSRLGRWWCIERSTSDVLHGRLASSVGRLAILQPRLVLVSAVVVAVLAAAAGWTVPERLSYRPGDFFSHASDSFRAGEELKAIQPNPSSGAPDLGVLVRRPPRSGGVRTARRLQRNPWIAQVAANVSRSRDGRASYIAAWLKSDQEEGDAAEKVARELDGPKVVVGGPVLASRETSRIIASDLRRAEAVAFPLLLLLGLWVFRSVVAAVLPVLVGGFSLLVTLGAFRVAVELAPLSVFSINIALALALGLGVDYSLLMVSRFREGLAAGKTPQRSAEETGRIAGTTVVYSCAAIAASFLSLLVIPIPFIRSVAFGGGLVAVVTGVSAILLAPAFLSLVRDNVNSFGPRAWQRSARRKAQARENGVWYLVARMAIRRRRIVAFATGGFLLVMTLPACGMRFTGLDVSSLPSSTKTRAFGESVRKEFDHPLIGELAIAIHGDQATASSVWSRIKESGERTGLGIPFPVGFQHSPGLWEVRLNPTKPVFSSASQRLVSQLRRMRAPITVGGETAAYMDASDALKHRLALALALIASSCFAFVFLATRSLVLPLKALVMNVLSLGAASGLLVFAFQHGRLEGALDYSSQGAFVIALPIMIVAAAFGLLTDYGLFLLLRIKEERERGLSDLPAIAVGLERTGGTITAAALLFCVAIGAFSSSRVLFLKEGAIGIVLTIVIDAFLVRALLVPSLMGILGRWNWWPRRLPG